MAMNPWMSKFSRDEIVHRTRSRIGEAGALPDDWNSEDPNCLQFVAWVYGYQLGDLSGRLGEIGSFWPQIRAYTGWALRLADEDPQPGDVLGLKFRFLWHVGVYVGEGRFVHVLGRQIRESRLRYWQREGLQVLAMPEGVR